MLASYSVLVDHVLIADGVTGPQVPKSTARSSDVPLLSICGICASSHFFFGILPEEVYTSLLL